MSSQPIRLRATVALAALLLACGGSRDAPSEALRSVNVTIPGSTDFDQLFLEAMLEHLDALTALSHAAREEDDSALRRVGQLVDLRHDVEKDQIRQLLRRLYRTHAPPDSSDQPDTTAARVIGGDLRRFRDLVIAIDEEAIRMIDTYLPQAESGQVAQLARRIRETRRREIDELRALNAREPTGP